LPRRQYDLTPVSKKTNENKMINGALCWLLSQLIFHQVCKKWFPLGLINKPGYALMFKKD
jgi:hypothetical protein